jgi:kumamolisin
LHGSARQPQPNAKLIGAVNPRERVNFTVYVRPRQVPAGLPSPEEFGEIPPQHRRYATAADIDTLFGADPEDLERVAAYAASKGLRVLDRNASRRSIELSGPARAAIAAFPAQLAYFDHPVGRYRGRIGPISVPAELESVIENIFGYDNRVVGLDQLRGGPVASRALIRPNAYYPPQVAQLYNYPTQYDGTGQCIGILVFNGALANTGVSAPGGYSLAALQHYFTDVLHMTLPPIADVVVHGPGNTPDPNDPNDVSDEVMLDIQAAGSCAPGARIVMYFTEFTEQGWVDAIVAAVHDDQNKPSVLSISYGNPEDAGNRGLWTEAAIAKVNQTLQVASYKGITVCCAAGDQGSSDLDPQSSDGLSHVDFPASSPYVLSCGGTRLESRNGVISSETVWNNNPASATGGGVSALFPVPQYQRYVTIPVSANPGHRAGRAVPDVSGLADPDTGVLIINVNGQPEQYPVGGTSLTTPLWAALIARINQALGVPVGFLSPILYKHFSSGVLRDITVGDNGSYRAGPGYDANTGLGSIDGAKLLAALQGLGAGAPQTLQEAAPVPPPLNLDARLARIERCLENMGHQQESLGRMLAQMANAQNPQRG